MKKSHDETYIKFANKHINRDTYFNILWSDEFKFNLFDSTYTHSSTSTSSSGNHEAC